MRVRRIAVNVLGAGVHVNRSLPVLSGPTPPRGTHGAEGTHGFAYGDAQSSPLAHVEL